jgi:cytochrome b subunit of formate dehydrogenase
MSVLALGLALPLLLAAPALKDEDCLACHEDKDLRSASGQSLFVDAARANGGVHGDFACVDCHAGIGELPHAEKLPKVDCGVCHDDTVTEYGRSVHGRAQAMGASDAATCRSCHGPAHDIVPTTDPASRVAKQRLADTCGSCHAAPDFLARHRIPFAKPVEAYRLSVHGRAVASGDEKAASCSDCHGSHGILPGRDPGSKINHWRVVETCGGCHEEVAATFSESVHGTAAKEGVAAAPVCTGCHGEHTILAPSEPGSLVNPVRVSSVTCGHCHGDERLARRYNLPGDKVPAFRDSYHGLALRSGSQTVANCASCHGVHNILPSSDVRSTVHPANLARTCGRCHPGAGQRFAIGAVHVSTEAALEHPVVRTIRLAYLVLIPVVIGGMLLHNAADYLVKLVRGFHRPHGSEAVERMNRHFRVAHGLVVLSFPALVISGFALKYPEAWWSGIPWRGELHRIAAVLLLAAVAYHVGHLWLVRRDRAFLRHMLPGLRDLRDFRSFLAWLHDRSRRRPRYRVFSYAEKAEYWAFVWGTVIMAATGFMLWFENWSLRHFPKWVTDAATALHWYEAILATLAILVWHFYLVIFDPEVYPMEKAWVTGQVPADHLRVARPAYLRALRAALRRRRREGEPT